MGHDQDHQSRSRGALHCGLHRQNVHSHKDLRHDHRCTHRRGLARIDLGTGLIFVGFTSASEGSDNVVEGKLMHKARGHCNWQQGGNSFYLSVVTNTRAEAVC